MKLNEKEIAELYQQATARQNDAACLGEALLLRAADDELSSSERERVAAHLAQCSDCAREYRIAHTVRPFALRASRAVGGGLPFTTGWSVAAAAILALAVPVLVWLAIVQTRNSRTIHQLRGQLTAQQRILSEAQQRTAAMDSEVDRLRRTLSELSRPQLGVPIVDLDADVTRGGAGAATRIVVPPTADTFTLVLHPPAAIRPPARIEVIDQRGNVIWSEEVRERLGTAVTVGLHRSLVPTGTYSIRLRSAVQTTTFHFHVDYR